MQWQEIRDHYPSQWLLVEAMKAHSEAGKRIVEDLTVINVYPDSKAALQGYNQIHKEKPNRELYVLHTDRKNLEITERVGRFL